MLRSVRLLFGGGLHVQTVTGWGACLAVIYTSIWLSAVCLPPNTTMLPLEVHVPPWHGVLWVIG